MLPVLSQPARSYLMLMAARVIENFVEDIENYRTGKDLIQQTVIGGGE